MEKKITKNEFHAYWQCPDCGNSNMDIADNFLLNIRKFECTKCGKKYSLKKEFTQILCSPLVPFC